MTDTNINFRCSREIATAFRDQCQRTGIAGSRIMRDLMAEATGYLARTDVWDRPRLGEGRPAPAQPATVSRGESAAILPGRTEEALLELGRLCTLANDDPRAMAREIFAEAASTMNQIGASVPDLIGQDVWDQFAAACQKCGEDPARMAATILHMMNRGLRKQVAAREGMQR